MSWSQEINAVNANNQRQKPLVDEQLQRNARKINEIIAKIRGRAKAAKQSPKCKNNDQNQPQKIKPEADHSPKVFIISTNPKQLTTAYCKKASSISGIFGYNAYFFFDKNANTHYRKVTTPLAMDLTLGRQGLDKCIDNIIQAVEEQCKNIDATAYLQSMLCIAYLARSGFLKGEFSADDLLSTKKNELQKICIFIPDQDLPTLEFMLGQQGIKYKTLTVNDFPNNRAMNPQMTQQPPKTEAVIKIPQSVPYTASSTHLSSTSAESSNCANHEITPIKSVWR